MLFLPLLINGPLSKWKNDMQSKFKDIRFDRVQPASKAKHRTHIAFLTINGDTESALIAELKKRYPKDGIELVSYKK